MTIYLFDTYCKSAVENIEKHTGLTIEYKCEPEKNLKLLMSKDTFLIDVFHTFIEPIVTFDDERTYERMGIVAFVKTREPRAGFREFIEFYHNKEKQLGIHSDAFNDVEFAKMKEHWAFGNNVDKFFDMMYAKYRDITSVYDDHNWIKDFDKMMSEFKVDKQNTLIIGDGLSDIVPAIESNVDLLLVPSFKVDRNFDYNRLIPKS